MCDICRQTPCHPCCPNADDPPTVYTCEHCKEPIVVGDEYYELEGEFYHEECLEDNAVEILIDRDLVTQGIAEEDE